MIAKSDFIPFALPEIGSEEIQEVTACLESGWLTTGPRTARFEQEFAAFLGVPFALAVNSGTAGLHLALEAAGIGPGDLVITSPYTFTATAEVVRYLGADIVLADIDPRTFNVNPKEVERAISGNEDRGSRIKGIIPVHFGGQACDMDSILTISRDRGLKVIEDAAHALPCTYDGKKIGALGEATVFSFYVTKTLATGEGGMVTTHSETIARRIKVMRLHGINKDIWDRYTSRKPNWYYEVVEPGFKYNMPDLMAAIGIHQLAKVERFRQKRQAIAEAYTKALADLPLKTPKAVRPADIHAWHLYVIQLELGKLKIARDAFIEKMAERGIGTSVHFIPLHLHPYWRDRYGFKAEDFPVALDCYERAVSLPIYSRMTDSDVERVIEAVVAVIKKSKK
jgi:dTDP-4-amino-4,6-dideoxygalactose transaminase